jgi:hypothetical protein
MVGLPGFCGGSPTYNPLDAYVHGPRITEPSHFSVGADLADKDLVIIQFYCIQLEHPCPGGGSIDNDHGFLQRGSITGYQRKILRCRWLEGGAPGEQHTGNANAKEAKAL